MIIDTTYFRGGQIALPVNDIEDAIINKWIEIVEPDVLQKLLGYELYKDFTENQSDAKWQAFINGYEYTYNDRLIKWNGLVNDDKKSLLAYFTYAEILRDLDDYISEGGAFKTVSEKAQATSVNSKLAYGFNKGVDLYGKDSCHPHYKSDEQYKPTAYNFLRYSDFVFDNWVFENIEYINRFGI